MTLISKIRLTSIKDNLALASVRAFSVKPMLNPKDEPREVIVRYLDGKDNGIAILGLNRPDAKNAFGKSLVSQLRDTISSLHKDDKVRIVIIRSLIPKVFCAGADLKERMRMDRFEIAPFVSSLRDLMYKIETLPTPTISAIDGYALGGGLELALATDIRTASSDAKIGLVETRLAGIPGAGGTQRLPRLVGVSKAKELIFTARVLDSAEAHKIGLVNQVVPQNKNGDAAYEAALSIAREILPNGPVAVKLSKVAINKGIEVPIEDGLEIEKECYSQTINTQDRLEGLAAFSTKRVPVYRGS